MDCSNNVLIFMPVCLLSPTMKGLTDNTKVLVTKFWVIVCAVKLIKESDV